MLAWLDVFKGVRLNPAWPKVLIQRPAVNALPNCSREEGEHRLCIQILIPAWSHGLMSDKNTVIYGISNPRGVKGEQWCGGAMRCSSATRCGCRTNIDVYSN